MRHRLHVYHARQPLFSGARRSHQKTVEGTLETLAERAAAASIASPALIVIGEVDIRCVLSSRGGEHKPFLADIF